MRIVFRTDASSEIGSGHVIRCMTLAEGLRSKGGDILFVCRSHHGNLLDVLSARGYRVAHLQTSTVATNPLSQHEHWLGATWEDDSEQTSLAMQRAGFDVADWLVVDHYAIDYRWETALRSSTARILCIDDLADRKHDCDILLDQNLVADFRHRYNHLVSKTTRTFLGPEFALLQPEYAQLRREIEERSETIRRVLIYFGASDPAGLTELCLSCVLNLNSPSVAVDVVASKSDPRFVNLEIMARTHSNVSLHTNLPTLAPLMAAADLAIGGAGATSWERVCLKLPAIVVVLAANQHPIATELHHRGLVRCVGSTATTDRATITAALENLTELQHSVSRSAIQVDGYGMSRIRDAMMATKGIEAR